jgi:cellulose synthase/poly-beta-1,6-N-acetylglucosamine synthase-like glycosyltransferase
LQNQLYVDSSACEIIVVDDGSVDATARLAEKAGVQPICHPQKRGGAAARNSGIRAARGEIVCFTDADCVPQPDWIAQIVSPLNDANIVGCKGTYATKQREVVARFVQLEYEDKYDRLLGQRRIDFIDTYSAAYRRRVLLANDGFDEDIVYVEDQELSFRLAARGYEMVFQPAAVVYHRHSHSLAAYARKKFMIGYWKSQIIRRFPDKAVHDSHTPQVMKVQIILMALMLLAAVATLVLSWSNFVLVIVTLAFLATTIPFCGKAWVKDRTVALVSPFMLAVRALALGAGYGWGLIRPQPGIGREENTIGGEK